MSCMTFECLDCGWLDFDNSRGPRICPKCGGEKVLHTFDEPPEREWPRDCGAYDEPSEPEEDDD
jgi:predicted  nucleic acid-binding Zn-ribbon protein